MDVLHSFLFFGLFLVFPLNLQRDDDSWVPGLRIPRRSTITCHNRNDSVDESLILFVMCWEYFFSLCCAAGGWKKRTHAVRRQLQTSGAQTVSQQ